MKQEVVAKINKFGKIGEVIAQISRVLLIMGAVILLAAGILMLAIPKDLITMDYFVGADVHLDYDAIGEIASVDDMTVSDAKSGEFSVSGNELSVVSVDVNEEENTLNIQMASQPTNIFNTSKMIIFIILEFLVLAAAFVTMTFITKLCKEIKTCETPFSESVIKRMKQVGYSMLPWFIVFPTAEAAANFLVMNNLKISLDPGMLIMALVVLALTYIFKYGAMLQQESDETL